MDPAGRSSSMEWSPEGGHSNAWEVRLSQLA
jgi:hypothetical protein